MNALSAFLTLLFVMDPLGNVPIFLAVLKDYDPQQRQRIIIRELLFALGVLLFFLFFGSHALAALSIKQESIRVAGSIVLLVIALRMVFPPEGGGSLVPAGQEPYFVPLAVPLVAGPSTIALIMLLVYESPLSFRAKRGILVHKISPFGRNDIGQLMSSTLLYRLLGQKGTTAIERLMGMLLIMIAVQIFLDGVSGFLRPLTSP